MTLILASGSASRQAMLSQAGVPFVVHPVRIDEDTIRDSLVADGALPHDIADAVAEFKAVRAVDHFPTDRVLACDQILDRKGRIFSKSRTRDAAKDTLSELQGTTHRLLSAAVIYENGEPVWRSTGQARLTMHPMTASQIDTIKTPKNKRKKPHKKK